jgi:hypothetical protein
MLLAGEEIQTIEQQLNLCRQIGDTLVMRADRDGYVDAWKIHERLERRPLRRGEPLLKVIAHASMWDVDVFVRQSRISHVQHAAADQSLQTCVSLAAQPDQVFAASLMRVGPTTKPKTQQAWGDTAVVLRLGEDARAMVSAARSEIQSGAPANVMFHCGSAPAGYLLFQDLIRSVRGSVGLYLSRPQNRSLGENP